MDEALLAAVLLADFPPHVTSSTWVELTQSPLGQAGKKQMCEDGGAGEGGQS